MVKGQTVAATHRQLTAPHPTLSVEVERARVVAVTGSIVCAIAGGSGSGKTTLATRLNERLGDHSAMLAIDWYYRDLAHLTMAERQAVNYDHPDSLEVELWCAHLDQLRSGQGIDAPIYDFATHTRNAETLRVESRPVIITEGILVLAVEEARPRFDLSVFLDVDAELRFRRRQRRDVHERGRDAADVRRQWNEFVAPMHAEFVAPSRSSAKVVLSDVFDLEFEVDALATALLDLAAAAPE